MTARLACFAAAARASTLGLAVTLAVVAPVAPARANGRPPVTNGVVFRPGDSQSIYVRSTFGLLISRDSGCSFRWVCEQSIGYGGVYDPKYAVAADGTLFATTFTGLRVSRDGGCSFTTATAELPAGAPGRIAGVWVDALDIGPTGEIWAATAEGGQPNDVYRSTDGGATFTPRNLASPTQWKSLVVAPSDAMRVYVSGYRVETPAPTAHLLSTTDGGQGWTESPLAGVQLAATPLVLVAAVDRSDPRRLYLVSVGASGQTGDRLYRSTDGGATFAEVLATSQPITGVVVHDATTVLVAADTAGAFRSTDGGVTFAPVAASPRLACLGQGPGGALVGCAPNWDPDFMAVGSSSDAIQWQKIFRFVELAGPLECPAGTPGRDTCDQELWPTLKLQFGATGPACLAQPDGPPARPDSCCDASAGASLGGGLLTALTVGWLGRRRRRPITSARRGPAAPARSARLRCRCRSGRRRSRAWTRSPS